MILVRGVVIAAFLLAVLFAFGWLVEGSVARAVGLIAFGLALQAAEPIAVLPERR